MAAPPTTDDTATELLQKGVVAFQKATAADVAACESGDSYELAIQLYREGVAWFRSYCKYEKNPMAKGTIKTKIKEYLDRMKMLQGGEESDSTCSSSSASSVHEDDDGIPNLWHDDLAWAAEAERAARAEKLKQWDNLGSSLAARAEAGGGRAVDLSSNTQVAADVAEYCRFGISIEGLEAFARKHAEYISDTTTTSDVCHQLIKPATVPPGWTNLVELIDPQKRWFRHSYRNESTGEVTDVPPPGSRSYCALLASNTETSAYVGAPTVFLSHAWSYCFRDVLSAARSFVDSQTHTLGETSAGGRSAQRTASVYFWFDCFAVDEHGAQSRDPDWWDSTFRGSIKRIGHTLMVLSPLHAPVPLTRAWCLWELLSTVDQGVQFSVCLPAREHASLHALLVSDIFSLQTCFGKIDAQQAQAGSADDRERIFAAIRRRPRGFHELNELAKESLRAWSYRAGMAALEELPAEERGTSELIGNLASYLLNSGHCEFATPLFEEQLHALRNQLGAGHVRTLAAMGNLGIARQSMCQYEAAESLLTESLAGWNHAKGEKDVETVYATRRLGLLYEEVARPNKAEPLLRAALRTCREICGDSVDTLVCLRSVAQFVCTLDSNAPGRGSSADIIDMFREALRISRRLDTRPLEAARKRLALGCMLHHRLGEHSAVGMLGLDSSLLCDNVAVELRVTDDNIGMTFNCLEDLGAALSGSRRFGQDGSANLQQLQEASELLQDAVLGKEMLLGENGARQAVQRLADVQHAIQQFNGIDLGGTDLGKCSDHGAKPVPNSSAEHDNNDDGVDRLIAHYGLDTVDLSTEGLASLEDCLAALEN